jgi:hypothetical protein
MCPQFHQPGLNSAELLELCTHKSTAIPLTEPILSPETGVRIPVAVLKIHT